MYVCKAENVFFLHFLVIFFLLALSPVTSKAPPATQTYIPLHEHTYTGKYVSVCLRALKCIHMFLRFFRIFVIVIRFKMRMAKAYVCVCVAGQQMEIVTEKRRKKSFVASATIFRVALYFFWLLLLFFILYICCC